MKRPHATWLHDKWLSLPFLALIAIGLVMVASASMVVSDRLYGYPFHFFFRQLVYVILGIGVLRVCLYLPLAFWQKYTGRLMLLAIFLAMIVLIPGVGRVVNGSRRWLHFGPLTIQVTEVVKLVAVLYIANYLERFQRQVQTHLIGFIKPMILLAVLAVLLLLEPDFGSLAVVTAIFMMLLFVANVRLWPFVVLVLLVVGAMIFIAIDSPYRLLRITTFMNPWGHQFGSGYQLTQSLIAFGRGGIFGVGLGNSIQKLFYLPEAHTDFLFAVIAEELGLLGELVIMGLYAILVVRLFGLAKKAFSLSRLFSAYLALGGGIWVGLQAMINIGVNAGILPTKGLTLPLISYGGSSMLMMCVFVGIAMRLSYELDQGGATNLAPRFSSKRRPR